LSKRDLKLKIDELSSALGTFKGLEIEVGRIYDEEWEEPMGPTPFPSVGTLRNWDRKLLHRYKPFYMPFCDLCFSVVSAPSGNAISRAIREVPAE
jgi:acetyl-CoA decarbonylase/synthase complex subunit alpha